MSADHIARLEGKIDEQAIQLANVNFFIAAVTPLLIRQESRTDRAKALGISVATLTRREATARAQIAMKDL